MVRERDRESERVEHDLLRRILSHRSYNLLKWVSDNFDIMPSRLLACWPFGVGGLSFDRMRIDGS